jgi:Xaa-Pro aminopeptidase
MPKEKYDYDLGMGHQGREFKRPYDQGCGTMGVDWEERINFDRMRKERLAKAKAALAKTDADAIFCYRLENVRYLTALRTHNWPMMFWGLASAVLPQRKDPILYTMDEDHAKLRMPWIRDSVFEHPGGGLEGMHGAKTWAEETKKRLEDLGIRNPRKIGVDSWCPSLYQILPKVFPKAEFVDGQHIMLEARKTKTQDEIWCLKMAYSITVAGFGAALDFLRPGRKECEVLAEAFRAMYSYGSEWTQCSNIVCSGGYLAPYRRFTSDRVIDYGDMVVIDIGAQYNGYYGDFTRTFICGKGAKATKEQIKIHMNAYNAMREAEKAIRPGVSSYEVSKAAGKWILGGLLGHGIGLGAAEPPYLGTPDLVPEDEAYILEPGMVFSVEPYAGIPGIGGVRLEDNIICTETGFEVYSKFPFEERLIE